MTVVNFPAPKKMPPEWQFSEVQKLMGACADALAAGEASGWETGRTERGEPQLYLLGPAPGYDCILCVSRVGNLYVLEDGNGRILFEHPKLMLFVEQARAAMRRRKGATAAKLVALWTAIRETFEEKMEPILHESAELLTHIGPQFAAFA